MDWLIIREGIRTAGQLIGPVSQLVRALKTSKQPSFQEAYNKMRSEAISAARNFEHSLDDILHTCKELHIDVEKSTLNDAEGAMSSWSLPRRMMFRQVSRRLWRLATGIKDFYADMEAIFACAEEHEILRNAKHAGYHVRDKVTDTFLRDTTIRALVETMREPVREALRILNA